MSRKQDKILTIREYILIRHNLVVAPNTTLEEVSLRINEYAVSETLFTVVFMDSINIEYQFVTKNNPGDHFLL